MPVPPRLSALAPLGCPSWAARRLTRRFHRLCARGGWVAYALRTRPPLSTPRKGSPARLACIRPAASVHPEPGSNSSLYYCFAFSFSLFSQGSSHRSRFLLWSLSQCGPRLAADPTVSCAGLKLSMNFASDCLPFSQTPLVFSGCKSTTFFLTRNNFFQLFSYLIPITLIVKKKKFNP